MTRTSRQIAGKFTDYFAAAVARIEKYLRQPCIPALAPAAPVTPAPELDFATPPRDTTRAEGNQP